MTGDRTIENIEAIAARLAEIFPGTPIEHVPIDRTPFPAEAAHHVVALDTSEGLKFELFRVRTAPDPVELAVTTEVLEDNDAAVLRTMLERAAVVRRIVAATVRRLVLTSRGLVEENRSE